MDSYIKNNQYSSENDTGQKKFRLKNIYDWPSPEVKKVWRFIRPLLILIISVGVTYFTFRFAFNYVLDKYINPVDINDPTPVEFVIDKNDSASKIASKLYTACGADNEGLISNTAVFKVYIDFVGKSKNLQEGTYILSKNMSIPQIVDILCTASPPKAVVNFTALEGYTISGIIYSLTQAKLEIDEQEFLAQCNNAKAYEKYAFINNVINSASYAQRENLLEGYLFPDTYEVYTDAKPNEIINKMLVRFNEIFAEEYVLRAEELGMTIDEVVTLASIIQREAALEEDFPKVSAVFHNRLKKNQPLESCATLQFVLKANKYVYSAEERATESPYNTYLHEGLPTGPICNPGKQAIEAALYPNEEYLEKGYLYFCNMDLPDNKALIFARTYEQHKKNTEKYQQYWK